MVPKGLNIGRIIPIVNCRVTGCHLQHVRVQRRRKELNDGSNEEIMELFSEEKDEAKKNEHGQEGMKLEFEMKHRRNQI
jgi:hypothetical protein